MAKTKVNSKGLVISGDESNGLSVDSSTLNIGFAPYGQSSATALTTSTTFSGAGVFTVSGSSALTETLPAASGSIGKMITMRALSAHQHIVTASNDTGTAICGLTEHGSQLTFDGVLGSSVTLLCDGLSWQVIGASGSLTYA